MIRIFLYSHFDNFHAVDNFSSRTDLSFFHINSTSVIRPFKRNKLSFSSIEVNKPLPASFHKVLQVRFKFHSKFQLLPQIRCLITLRMESSITSIDSNITDNIIRKVINVLQEKCRAKNGALKIYQVLQHEQPQTWQFYQIQMPEDLQLIEKT